jgi:TPP-dependent indolepyruvate ferredoxin oxidoreductase alpha subunit
MTICRDGSVGLRQPARFNRILLNMEEGVVLTETDQMRVMWRTLGDIIQVREKMEQEVARERAIEREQEQDMEDEARGVKRPFSQVD